MAWSHWEPVAFSEIDPFASAVLAHRFPTVPNWGDMTKFEEWPDVSIDLICGGTPCQSFSIAGLRKGLDDPRGNLMLTFGHILGKYRPAWFVWENVPGVLSSDKGRDFASFLGLVTGQAIEPPADGWRNSGFLSGIDSAYGIAWRVLDAQYTRSPKYPRAVPQRRRRVFVVGYLGDWRRAAAVLLDSESLSGNPSPRREAGQRVAPGVTSGPPFSRTGNERIEAEAMVVEGYTAGSFGGYRAGCGTLRGEGGDLGGGSETLVAHTLSADGFDASEDGTGRGTPIVCVSSGQVNAETSFDHAPALTCLHEAPIVAMARESGQGYWMEDEVAGTIDANMGLSGQKQRAAIIAIQERAICENPDSGPDGVGVRTDGVAYTLEARTVPQAVAVRTAQTSSNGHGIAEEVAHTIDGAQGQAVATLALRQREGKSGGGKGPLIFNEHSGTLATNNDQTLLTPQMAVRRLTPTECERLQGFEDGHTNVPYRNKGASPVGPRYKAIGNSMAVPCVEWIGLRIEQIGLLT